MKKAEKVVFKKNPEPIPDKLLEAFKQNPAFKKAFYALTPGRQRGYSFISHKPNNHKQELDE